MGTGTVRDRVVAGTAGDAVRGNQAGALADLAPWRRVPGWSWSQMVELVRHRGVEASAAHVPTAPLLAAGLAKSRHAPPWGPLRRFVQRAAQKPALAALESLQGVSGGFAESIPQTSFVLLSLAGAGLHEHPVVRRGVQFLLSTVHSAGGWPSRRQTA